MHLLHIFSSVTLFMAHKRRKMNSYCPYICIVRVCLVVRFCTCTLSTIHLLLLFRNATAVECTLRTLWCIYRPFIRLFLSSFEYSIHSQTLHKAQPVSWLRLISSFNIQFHVQSGKAIENGICFVDVHAFHRTHERSLHRFGFVETSCSI